MEALLPSVQVQPSNITLKTYTGETIPVKGTLSVDVNYGQQVYHGLKLLIVQGAGPSLLGRDWLRVVKLDWRNIAKVAKVSQSSSLESRVAVLRDRYREVFSESLGTIAPFQAKLSVNDGARPKFFKPRPVPFALRERVEQELDRLERDGVLERTHYSEWAAPIVAVPKSDGKIRLCGDYKVTVNPVLDVDQYPLPKPDDIFATLSGGQHFTPLDLTHAYNQLLLDEESRKFVTVNTHKGLYQYTRLPFGIASAPVTHNGHYTAGDRRHCLLHRRHNCHRSIGRRTPRTSRRGIEATTTSRRTRQSIEVSFPTIERRFSRSSNRL